MNFTAFGAVALAYQLVAVVTGLPRISVLWPWNALGAVAFLAHFALERRSHD